MNTKIKESEISSSEDKIKAKGEAEKTKEQANKKAEKSKEGAKKTKGKAEKTKGESKQKVAIPSLHDLDFSNDSKNEEGEKWNWKIASWNVNGVRAWFDVSLKPSKSQCNVN